VTFRTARQGHVDDAPFLQTDHFAETVTYQPNNGRARPVVVGIVYAAADDVVGEMLDLDAETIWVFARKSTSGTKSGIDQPRRGDQITRPDDDASRPFTYQGQIRNERATDWELLFARRRTYRTGPT